MKIWGLVPLPFSETVVVIGLGVTELRFGASETVETKEREDSPGADISKVAVMFGGSDISP